MTGHPPTVPVCMFDGTEVTITNIFIIITPVNLTILFYHSINVPAVVVSPPPARNPVDQALAWIGFGMEVKLNRIRDEGGLESFDDLVGLTESDIRYMTSVFSERTTA